LHYGLNFLFYASEWKRATRKGHPHAPLLTRSKGELLIMLVTIDFAFIWIIICYGFINTEPKKRASARGQYEKKNKKNSAY